MQSVAVLFAVVAVAHAATVYHVPSADSAVIESHRLGGSFAYSTSEAQGLGVVSPVVQNVVSPVATSYSGLPVTSYSVQGLPVTSYSVQGLQASSLNVQGLQASSLNLQGLPVSSLGNVAVVRSGQVQNLVVPSTVSGVSTLGNLNYGVLPVSSYVVSK
ncbi:unnamed protein product [Orchesella dallaii]|uniref:Cuticle protein n=1 Tax=Orchesella dallaii TaxID=48710 RepID=A0ABP1RRE2_9HEXA